ncbi:TonB family protein [Oleidesulfovibrio alaskensis G20]|jgi:protein TonB|uniref:TonB family protein n=1 Tax=Oleidesulfovibrio alaskensis (strain ATCC BAA-1058 / DSM 17464 / G20) TaxID=207559 RepID=Q315Y9_OLEA2|nr:energy transducer TonB [Oleidesulfovibrio alaskensis]ABB37257.1 TonB family protein [Oleidesulfovibrio alaskensis G20]MBG0772561.1 energy transducer TonB [Oleidesulfovibrio alaskensis]
MTDWCVRMAAVGGGVGVTLLLLLFLLAGTAPRVVTDEPVVHGAVRLSSFTEAPVRETETYATRDVQQVQPLEKMSEMDVSLDSPQLEMDMPSMEMDFAPELAGTVPLSGVPSVASAGGLSAPSGGAFTLGEVDEQPRPLYAPAPLYPMQEKRLGRECTVVVRILLAEDGTVKQATPVYAEDDTRTFHEAAVETVLRWRFVPCRKDGRAVQCIAEQPFTFSLHQ